MQRWSGDVETVDAVYFLTAADTIRAAYKARGIGCFLVEEPEDADDETDETGADSEAAKAGEKTETPSETPPEKAAKAKDGRAAAKRVK